jgi:hypothetical protein
VNSPHRSFSAAGDEFAILYYRYGQLSRSEAANYEIITMADVEPDVACEIVGQWVRKNRSI